LGRKPGNFSLLLGRMGTGGRVVANRLTLTFATENIKLEHDLAAKQWRANDLYSRTFIHNKLRCTRIYIYIYYCTTVDLNADTPFANPKGMDTIADVARSRAHDNVFCSESYKVFFPSYLNTMETISPLVSYVHII